MEIGRHGNVYQQSLILGVLSQRMMVGDEENGAVNGVRDQEVGEVVDKLGASQKEEDVQDEEVAVEADKRREKARECVSTRDIVDNGKMKKYTYVVGSVMKNRDTGHPSGVVQYLVSEGK